MLRRILIMLPLALLLPATLQAQDSNGAAEEVGLIQGVIMDMARQNAPVVGALVKYESIKNRVKGEITSNDVGAYRIEKLPPGQYTITVEAEGYAVRQGIPTSVISGRESVFNIPLRPKPNLLNSFMQNRMALAVAGFVLGLVIGLLAGLMMWKK